MTFEKALWHQLQAVHEVDMQLFNWCVAVESAPENSNFSFSVGGRAFFLIGMHSAASRAARRTRMPVIVFNLHEQFVELRANGKFDGVRNKIQQRDKQLQGTINPMAADKKQAHAYVFDSTARLLGSSAVLLGATRGDDSVRGIGLRPLSQVRLAERTTPAGRFVAEPGRNLLGEDVVWVDYDAAISMHRVRTTNPAEQRLERLASENPDDKRISYGCINVPAAFYEAYVRPTFASQRAIVYVLPEIKPVEQMFGSHAVPTTASRRLVPSYL